MTNEFTVKTGEIFLLDEPTFVASGGKYVHFGAMDGDSVHLFAVGSAAAIRCVAQQIIAHGTATRCHAQATIN